MKYSVSTWLTLLVGFLISDSTFAQTIITQPVSATINNASTVEFTVVATNATTYRWNFNGTNLSDGGDISGSTNATLTLENVSSNEIGSYGVVINGTLQSSNATLNVIPGTIVHLVFSGLTNGLTNTMDLQLFDHDKPGTVANFIHYLHSGAFSNMFYERCVLTDIFVLQGGSYTANDRTNTASPIIGSDVQSQTTLTTNLNPPFPIFIDSEFGVEPLIHNRFGTVAMALQQGSTNSASSAFFFNLADNSTNLDTNNGGFTVFGRILNGSNVLQYFYGLTNGANIVSNDYFSDNGVLNTNLFSTLPVNYSGTNLPGNANLVYSDFTLPTNTVIDTTPPTLTVTSDLPPMPLTNGATVSLAGTASDNVAVTSIISYLIPQASSDGKYQYNGRILTNFGVGTSDWSLDVVDQETYYLFGLFPVEYDLAVAPGSYILQVEAQDGSGNLSAVTNLPISVTGVMVDGDGTVAFASSSANPIGYPMESGSNYSLIATPAAGQTFVNWSYNGIISTNRNVSFTYNLGVLTATFLATNGPRGVKAITFTYPAPNSSITTNSFVIKGHIAASVKMADISLQIFSDITGDAVTSTLTTRGTNTWSIPVTNLPPDDYTVQVVATNENGFGEVVSEKFAVTQFKNVAGTYTGLFLCTNSSVPIMGTNSGFVTFTIAANGVFSGRVEFPAYRALLLHGTYYADGAIFYSGITLPSNTIDMIFVLDLTNGTQTIRGSVYSTSGSWASPVVCYRSAGKLATSVALPGKYVLDLDPLGATNWPATNGYSTLSVSTAGVAAVSGELPDGAAFSSSTAISTNGVWPVYTVPTGYKTNGILMGWETNQAGAISGRLYWRKTSNFGTYISGGVRTNLVPMGTNFSKPLKNTTYSITFGGATLTNTIVNPLTVNAAGQFVVQHPAPTDKLAISLSANGVLSGHFTSPVSGKVVQFKGGFMDPTQGGWGFFLDEDGETGYFSVTQDLGTSIGPMKRFLRRGILAAFSLVTAVASAQSITNGPQSLTVNNASTATFTVGTVGATNYQWLFNGTNLADGGGITGSLTTALTLEDVSSNEAGTYSVVVNNTNTSAPATLTIIPGTIVTIGLTGLTNGTATNFIHLQLFDHDKPATVENFLHYLRSGAYTNMFFDRCVPGFVLQGGSDAASNQTDTLPPVTGWDIASQFLGATNINPPFPQKIVNEFNVGPVIHNRFGTVAMAKLSGDPNSATHAFFFNLADNFANLDGQNGGFTVFGQILDGTNVLQYFNGLATFNGIYTNGLSVNGGTVGTNLPVNYAGTNSPANDNLVFCNFGALTNAPLDTNPPTVAIASPLDGAVTANGNPAVTGLAGDDVAVALVTGTLTPIAAADGTVPNNGVILTTFALGTTNWSMAFTNTSGGVVPPGNYTLSVVAQDGAGNLSLPATQTLIVTAILTNGFGSVTISDGFTEIDAVGYPFQDGSQYTLKATPGSNFVFENWTAPSPIAVDSTLEFTMGDSLVLTANFVTNSLNASVAFTYPVSNSIISTDFFSIAGTISNLTSPPATVVCQLYSQSSYAAVGPAWSTNGVTSNWSVAISTNLPPDFYAVQATITDASSNSTLIVEDFQVATNAILNLKIVGSGTVSPVTNGQPIVVGTTFQVTATPLPNQLFYAWTNANGYFLNPTETFTMQNGLSLTAIFVTNNAPGLVTISNPPTNAPVGPTPIYLEGGISNAVLTGVGVTYQIVSLDNPLVFTPVYRASVSGNGTWDQFTSLLPDSYALLVVGTNATGGSTLATENFTVSSNLPVQINISGQGSVSPVTNGQVVVFGTNFVETAGPGTQQSFYSWTEQSPFGSTEMFANPTETFTNIYGLALTATFVTNNFPGLITITNPLPGAIVGSNAVSFSGTIATNANSSPVTVTFQLISQTNPAYFEPLGTTTGTGSWSTGYPGITAFGPYTLLVTATDAAGDSAFLSENINVEYSGTVHVAIVGQGTVSGITNGAVLPLGTNIDAVATPASGWAFYSWSDGSQLTPNAAQGFTNSYGLTLTATFVPSNTARGITITYPLPKAKLATNNFIIKGRVLPNFGPASIVCQIFQSNGVAIGPAFTTSATSTWSFPVQNLPGGTYELVATAIGSRNASAVASEFFTVLPLAAVAGTYTGLFICTNAPVSSSNSGFLSFTVNAAGLVTSGKVQLPAHPPIPIYYVPTTIYGNVVAGFSFGISNFYGKPLQGSVYLGLGIGDDEALGVISSDTWSSPLQCFKAVTKLSPETIPANGRYSLVLQSPGLTNNQGTNGSVALLASPNGTLSVSGSLPDNTTFSASTKVSKNGYWPLFAIPAGTQGKGLLLGWETNVTAGNSSGQLYWFKPSRIGSYFTNGIGLETNLILDSTGHSTVLPAVGSHYSIVFAGGSLTAPLTNNLTVARNGQFTVSGGADDKLRISLAPTGVISGLINNGTTVLHFKGMLTSPTQGGSGFVPESGGQVGTFQITSSDN